MARKVDIVSNLLTRDLEEALLKVFLALDGRSILACSLVCKSWQVFLSQRVWNNRMARPALRATLNRQWGESRPSGVLRTLTGRSQGFDIVCDNELTLVGMNDGKVNVLKNIHFCNPSERRKTVVKEEEEECSIVATLDCFHKHPYSRLTIQFWLGPEVIVTVGEGLVQCWNRQTFDLEYKRAHHVGSSRADVFGVTILGSGAVATGANGGEVVVLHKKERWWKWLETGKDEGPIWSVKVSVT